MTDKIQNFPKDEDSEFFNYHEWGLVDHAWAHLWDEARELNAANLSIDDLKSNVDSLNQKLYQCGHFEAKVLISGRMRDFRSDDDVVLGSGSDSGTILVSEDQEGSYKYVIGEELQCYNFIIYDPNDDDEDDENDGYDLIVENKPPKIVLTLGDPERHYDDSGPLYIYPEEIEQAVFTGPEYYDNQQYLQYFHPEILEHIEKMLPISKTGRIDAVSGLKNIFIRNIDPDTMRRVEAFIFQRLNLDEFVTINVNGEISSVSEDNEEAETTYEGKLSPFDASRIWLRPGQSEDGPCFRPSLVGVVMAPEVAERFQVRIIPPESLKSIKSLRPRESGFGEVALKGFDFAFQAYDYMNNTVNRESNVAEEQPLMDNIDISPEEREVFDGIVGELSNDPDFTSRTSRLNNLLSNGDKPYNLENADEGISKIQQSLRKRLNQISKKKKKLSEPELKEVVNLVLEDMITIDDILPEEILQTGSECHVMDMANGAVKKVPEGIQIRGEFIQPLVFRRVDSGEYNLGLVLDGVRAVYPDGKTESVFEEGICAILVDTNVRISRVIYENSQTEK